MAQISDNMRTIWHPGFFIRPSVSSLSFKDQGNDFFQKYEKKKSSGVPDYYNEAIKTTVGTDTIDVDYVESENSISMLAYGISTGFNNILFGQWFNSASFSFDFLRPKYGEVMDYYSYSDTPTEDPDNPGNYDQSRTYVEDGANTNSVHLQFEDVILHANHTWGSVLPFAGFGVDYYKLGGALTYTDGAQRTSQVIYVPLGAYFQMNPAFSGKMQLNIPVSAKSKYTKQTAEQETVNIPVPNDPTQTTTENRQVFSFDTSDTEEFSHPVSDSIGLEASLLIHSNVFGAGFRIEPYLKLLNLGAKANTNSKQLSRRWRSFGLRASASF